MSTEPMDAALAAVQKKFHEVYGDRVIVTYTKEIPPVFTLRVPFSFLEGQNLEDVGFSAAQIDQMRDNAQNAPTSQWTLTEAEYASWHHRMDRKHPAVTDKIREAFNGTDLTVHGEGSDKRWTISGIHKLKTMQSETAVDPKAVINTARNDIAYAEMNVSVPLSVMTEVFREELKGIALKTAAVGARPAPAPFQKPVDPKEEARAAFKDALGKAAITEEGELYHVRMHPIDDKDLAITLRDEYLRHKDPKSELKALIESTPQPLLIAQIFDIDAKLPGAEIRAKATVGADSDITAAMGKLATYKVRNMQPAKKADAIKAHIAGKLRIAPTELQALDTAGTREWLIPEVDLDAITKADPMTRPSRFLGGRAGSVKDWAKGDAGKKVLALFLNCKAADITVDENNNIVFTMPQTATPEVVFAKHPTHIPQISVRPIVTFAVSRNIANAGLDIRHSEFELK